MRFTIKRGEILVLKFTWTLGSGENGNNRVFDVVGRLRRVLWFLNCCLHRLEARENGQTDVYQQNVFVLFCHRCFDGLSWDLLLVQDKQAKVETKPLMVLCLILLVSLHVPEEVQAWNCGIYITIWGLWSPHRQLFQTVMTCIRL